MRSLTLKDNGSSLELAVGESLSIRLSENATTGYRWRVEDYDKDLLELLPDQPTYAGPGVGSGGEVTMTLRARKPGSTDVLLKNRRAWEGADSGAEQFHVRVVVKAPARGD